MSELVSVIIPVYNSETYLVDCLNALLNQAYNNIEIIVIDDGSTDNSFSIIQKFAEIDHRICAFYKNNTGVSDSRNMAIEKANGKYIAFCDSDDIVDPCYIKVLVETIEEYNADMSVIGYSRNLDEIKYINKESHLLKNEDVYSMIIDGNGYLWNKLFRSEIIKKNKVKFDKDLFMCEDMVFILEYMKYVSKVSLNNNRLYYYREVDSSASKSKLSHKRLSEIVAREKILELLNSSGCNSYCIKKAENKLIQAYCFFAKDIVLKSNDNKLKNEWIPYIIKGFDSFNTIKIIHSLNYRDYKLLFSFLLLELTKCRIVINLYIKKLNNIFKYKK